MRLTEFWWRMEHHLGAAYARTWARDQVLAELGGRTVVEALDAGWDAKVVWRAVWRALELPPSER
ncbi:DUF3046 domain-containing protein [Actinopolymorpha alba]|uniref:DUF3046 domain-containing protein n=1 Tax=Actinopolymorpha alba TaxID=533267 RepID=UPI0003A4DD75|nr:DUF3046 domain-containing protein [Actinopolymorpha alba]